MESKKPWQSKTNWVALLIAVASFFPQVQALIISNPEGFGVLISGVFTALRFVTKNKIVIK